MKKILFICLPLVVLVFFGCRQSKLIELASPDGQLIIRVSSGVHLSCEVIYKGNVVVASSPIGVTINDADAGKKAVFVSEERYAEDNAYPWIGIHDTIVNRYNGATITLKHPVFKTFYLNLRAFDDGVAYSFTVPGTGDRAVQGENTIFRLPEGSTVWYHDFYMHYEGEHVKKSICDVKEGEWMAPPITVKLKDGLGYLSFNEAAVYNYSGMGFQADGKNGMRIRLAHEQPASYPFVLRYSEDDVKRLALPPMINGDVITPWRTVVVVPDLNGLVNNDILYNLSPEPDKNYFPEGRFADWLKPGRAVWDYLVQGVQRTVDGMKLLARQASELGFEYQVIEGFWTGWTVEQQKEYMDYARKLNIRVLLWKHSKDLWDIVKRVEFFDHLQSVGAAGTKIDFFDHEAKEIEDLYLSCLKLAAERQLVIDFHGASKPTGEAKTWPNELTREAIKGFETRGPWARHNATLPFTRMVAGHADYTPMHFGPRKAETTDVHQIASALLLGAPLLVYAGDPGDMLKHPAVEVIKQIPSVFDQTIVLEPSEIGEVAVFARRTGNKWFLAALNGAAARTITVNLSFLDNKREDRYMVTLVRDNLPTETVASFNAKRVTFGASKGALVNTLTLNQLAGDKLIVELLPAGGFVAVFHKITN